MNALTTLTRTQAKVFLREPTVVAFGILFPAVLLLVIGSVFPGATEANTELGNRSLVEIYAPATAVMALLTLGSPCSHRRSASTASAASSGDCPRHRQTADSSSPRTSRCRPPASRWPRSAR